VIKEDLRTTGTKIFILDSVRNTYPLYRLFCSRQSRSVSMGIELTLIIETVFPNVHGLYPQICKYGSGIGSVLLSASHSVYYSLAYLSVTYCMQYRFFLPTVSSCQLRFATGIE
jgi:hypothetical protein